MTVLYADCDLSRWQGDPKRCRWCDALLTGRQQAWCGQPCVEAWGANHWWTNARPVVLARDDYTCVRCGKVGWADVPYDLLPITEDDGVFATGPAMVGDWAVALGLLEVEYWKGGGDHWEDPALDWESRWARVREAERQVPEGALAIVRSEDEAARRAVWGPSARHSRYGAGHDLEVNHIVPVRGVRDGGCLNHLANLETLCRRPCHVEETRLQRVTVRSIPGPRTIACWEGLHDRCWTTAERPACMDGCHPWVTWGFLRVDPSPPVLQEAFAL